MRLVATLRGENEADKEEEENADMVSVVVMILGFDLLRQSMVNS